jgi:hypothetical protein
VARRIALPDAAQRLTLQHQQQDAQCHQAAANLLCAQLRLKWPCRYMFDPDGTFNDNHINNWQHAAMYLGYMVAGVVDVAAHFTDLPADCGQARPAAAPALY